MQVEWHPLALEDRDVIVAYLELLNPNAASSVLRGLVLAGDSLALFPTRGRVGLATGTRELVAVWRPYLIVYEVDMSSDTARILRIWHVAQDRP